MSDPVDRSLLEAGERVLWRGAPSQRPYARHRLGLYLTGVIFFIGLPAVSLVVEVMKNGGIAFGYGFLLSLNASIGVAFLSVPCFRYREAPKIVYAITNRRALILKGYGSRIMTSKMLRTIEGVSVKRESADGIGDLMFFNRETSDSAFEDGFIATPSVRSVERLLKQLVSDGAKAFNARLS